MSQLVKISVLLLTLVLMGANSGRADDEESAGKKVADFLSGLSFSGEWYLAYSYEQSPSDTINEFRLKRGYVTVQKKFSKRLSTRVTQDVSVDHEGDGEGDIEVRLKYMYVKYRFDDFSVFTKPFVEFGLVHRPWLDFEQKVNPYRVQGTMYLERYYVLRSADYGITFGALLGGKMDEAYSKSVGDKYPGRYGSMSVGVYNGGGYHAVERNDNKLVETRVTLRPLPDQLPGAQISWVGGLGKGNQEESPDLFYNAAYLSYQHPDFQFNMQAYYGEGDIDGEAILADGESYNRDGFSAFTEIRYPWNKLALLLRYDRMNDDTEPFQTKRDRYIAGISYRFHKGAMFLLHYDRLDEEIVDTETEELLELAVRIAY